MSNEKTHYRKVFKSDHLGVADLEEFIEEGKPTQFTIREVKQEYDVAVAGRKGNYNIAYFTDRVKPLVLNATNSKVLKSMTGSAFVEDWKGQSIEVYVDASVKMKGEVVGGLRIRPAKAKPAIPQGALDKSIQGIEVGQYKVEQVQAHYLLTSDQLKQLQDAAKKFEVSQKNNDNQNA